MDYEPIEGVDYIFDRYAYLGLDTDASAGTIKKTIRQKRSEVHPDAVRSVHPDIVKKSDAIRNLIDQCAVILEDDALRPLYTARLLEFRREKPEVVSTNGNVIESLSREHVDLSLLLEKKLVDLDQFKDHVQKLSGYSPKQVAAAQKFYAADPSEDNRELLESSLSSKLTYLSIFEGAAWKNAEIGNIKMKEDWMLDPEEYTSRVEDEIQARHAAFSDVVRTRNGALLIGVAKPVFLLQDGNGKLSEPPRGQGLSTEVQQQLTERAQQVFLERADLIRQVAKEKQQVLSELVSLTHIKDFGIPVDPRKPYGLHLMIRGENEKEEPTTMCSFQVSDKGTITLSPKQDSKGMTYDQLKGLGMQGCAIRHNPEISDFVLEVGFAAQRYTDAHLTEVLPPAHPGPVKDKAAERSQPRA